MNFAPLSDELRVAIRTQCLTHGSKMPAETVLCLLADLERVETYLANYGFRIVVSGSDAYLWNGKDSEVFPWPHAWEPNLAEAIAVLGAKEDV